MRKSPLEIISIASQQGEQRSPINRIELLRAEQERLWKKSPERFDPSRTALDRERLERTWYTLQTVLRSAPARAADLGFGWGTLTRRLAEAGLEVDAIDIAGNAVKHFEKQPAPNIRVLRESLPHTTLRDAHYDLVLCAELIADMHPHDQRLLISEIYRMLTSEGRAVISSALDIDTVGALDSLMTLIETELLVERRVLSHHLYCLRWLRFLRYPSRIVKAKKESSYRERQKRKRGRCRGWWFLLQCKQPFYSLWWLLAMIAKPLAKGLEQSDRLVRFLERLCRTLKPIDGVSHVIFVAKKKPLQESAEIAESKMSRPIQRLRERVWE